MPSLGVDAARKAWFKLQLCLAFSCLLHQGRDESLVDRLVKCASGHEALVQIRGVMIGGV
jgi:hypothetical protein